MDFALRFFRRASFSPHRKSRVFLFFFGVRVFRLERDFGGGEGEFSEMKEGRELNGIEWN